MKTKKKCENCSKRFEAVRSDAKYCSRACKQKAFGLKKKKEATETGSKIIFYFDEYQYILRIGDYDTDIFTFTFFCFLRKNFPQNANVDSVMSYINSIWTYNNYDELTGSKAFQAFWEQFLSNEFFIFDRTEFNLTDQKK